MDKNAFWKWLILIGLMAFSVWVVTPPKKKIRLGLDLKGGTSFVVKIDEEKIREDILSRGGTLTEQEVAAQVGEAMDGAQKRALQVLRNRVDNLGISEPVIYPGKNNRIIIQLPGVSEEQREKAEQSIQSVAFLEFRMVHEDNAELVDRLFEENATPEGYRIVHVNGREYYDVDPNYAGSRGEDYRARLRRFHVPGAGYEFMLSKEDLKGREVYTPYFVKTRPELTGQYLKSASVDYQAFGQPVVNLEFDRKGARRFANITSDYAPGGPRNPNPNGRRYLAIVLDGTLYSAPWLKTAIYNGRAIIEGQFSLREAKFLANILKAGSLPAPVKIEEKRFVAPSLGADSIRSGIRAVVYGGVGVLLFMLVYYLLSGFIADLALVLNMLLLPLGMIAAAGFLGMFSRNVTSSGAIQLPVLTLPGIAGILLTIGMAVDANVLIFERIREESRSGKRLWSAITAGYDRAFVTIMDANLTTLLTGIILFIFGSGPIRGFAVTLCAGLVVSMFTALVVTKLFFGILAAHTKVKALHMLRLVKETSIRFVEKRKIAAALSIGVIAVSWAVMVYRGVENPGRIFGVDFVGGASATFTFQERKPVQEIREALEAAGLQDVHIQYQQEIEKGGDAFLQVKVGDEAIEGVKPVEIVKKTMEDRFGSDGYSVVQEDDVGPQIGRELKRRAMWSIVFALLGMIVYISWRFELGFAVGAIVALTHDVLVTVGLYTALFGRQLSLPVVAAVLTIVGYSVNDTIVVFDRIREDLRTERSKTFKEICNLSVNQTLSRTLLTSLTTLIAVGMLLVFGGGAINDFALTLCIGVIVGTYSSVFVATPVVLLWHRDRKPEFAAKGR